MFPTDFLPKLRMEKVDDLIKKMLKYGFSVVEQRDCGQHNPGIWLTKIIMRKVTFTTKDLT